MFFAFYFQKTNHTAQVSPFGPPPLSVNRNRNTTNHRRSDSYDPHNMTPLFFRQDPTSLRKRRPGKGMCTGQKFTPPLWK